MVSEITFAGERLMTAGGINLMASKSQSGVWYHVGLNVCECKSFQHRGTCRHIKTLREFIIGPSTPTCTGCGEPMRQATRTGECFDCVSASLFGER